MLDVTAIILLGAVAGGFVNGLTGFGTGLTAMPIWLQALSPVLATQLAASASVTGQVMTLRAIWASIDWRALAPMLLAGLVGVPVGAALVPLIDVQLFKLAVGCILVGYAAVMLGAGDRLRLAPRGPGSDVMLGFASGILGGIAGLSGVLPTIWGALQGWSKERRRGVLQAFNFTILSATLLAHAAGGYATRATLMALLLALPGTVIGVMIGQHVYQRLDDRRYDRVVLYILGIAGLGLLVTTVGAAAPA